MVRCILFLLVATGVIGQFVSCGGNDHVIPAADFFSEPEKTSFQLSPNGEYLAYLGQYNGQKNIFMIHLDEGSREQRITSETELGIQSFFWANDDELIFTKDRRRDSLQVFAVNRATLGVRHLILPSAVKLRWISPSKVVNNGFLISLNERDSSVFDVYRLRTDACRKELVAKNPGNIIRWYADVEGKLRLALASDSLQETMLYRDSENEPFRAVVSNHFRNSIMPLGFSAKNRNHIFALSNINRDKLALVELDMHTGREVQLIYSHPDVDMSHGGYSTDRGEMAYASYFTWKQQRHFLNPQTKNVYHKLAQKLKEYELVVLDRDTARRRFIVRSYTDKDPGAVYYYDMAADKLVKLVDNNPALKDRMLAEMKPVTYHARDGRQIHGYLTMPREGLGKLPPVIVYPHSGPSRRDRWGFDPEVQFFANRGYAVFQVNYRGSTGYGKEFWSAGSKEWGGKVQDDITDGVRWLIREGQIDSTRIGIYGAGFGGYSALYGACFYSGLYRCAASYSGFINLFTYLKEVPPYVKPYLQMYYETVGNPETEPKLIKSMSPIFHADQINIPVFVAQGGRDKWSTVNETNQFVQKLKKRKVPITYMLREEEGRYFRNEENRVLFYNSLVDFFDKYLK